MELVTIAGYCAATLTTIAFVPQVIKVMKEKHTKDISLAMYLIFTIGVVMWLIYGILLDELPIILANIITLCLASIILGYKFKYK